MLAFALMLGCVSIGQAQSDPYGTSFGIGEMVNYDSNFFRLPQGAGGSNTPGETSYDTYLVGTFHQVYSRQEVTASANIGRVLDTHYKQFDFTQESIRAALQSSLPYNIATNLDVSRTMSLAHFADIGVSNRNVITSNHAGASADFPLTVDFRAVLGGSVSQTRNSAGNFSATDFNYTDVNGGIRYQPTTGNHIDLLAHSDLSQYPNASAGVYFLPNAFLGPSFRERGADLKIDWTFSGFSHANGRAGFVQRRDDFLTYADPLTGQPRKLDVGFSGPAYDLSYTWAATTITRLTISVSRQTGAAGDNSYLMAVSKSVRVSPSYQASSKIAFDAFAEFLQRNYLNSVYEVLFAAAPGTIRQDRGHNAGLHALWAPWRWFQTSLDLHREIRTSTIPSWNYADKSASLNIQGNF